MLTKYTITKHQKYYLLADFQHYMNSSFYVNTPVYDKYLSAIRYKELQGFITNRALSFMHKHNVVSIWNESNEINQYHEAIAMAYYYLSNGTSDGAINMDDIGVTIFTSEYPLRLVNYLRDHNYQVSHSYPGVYYVYKDGIPDTQIVIYEPVAYKVKSIWKLPNRIMQTTYSVS